MLTTSFSLELDFNKRSGPFPASAHFVSSAPAPVFLQYNFTRRLKTTDSLSSPFEIDSLPKIDESGSFTSASVDSLNIFEASFSAKFVKGVVVVADALAKMDTGSVTEMKDDPSSPGVFEKNDFVEKIDFVVGPKSQIFPFLSFSRNAPNIDSAAGSLDSSTSVVVEQLESKCEAINVMEAEHRPEAVFISVLGCTSFESKTKLFCLGAAPNSQIFPSLFLSKNAAKIDCEAKSCVLPPAERRRNLSLQLKSFFFFLIQRTSCIIRLRFDRKFTRLRSYFSTSTTV